MLREALNKELLNKDIYPMKQRFLLPIIALLLWSMPPSVQAASTSTATTPSPTQAAHGVWLDVNGPISPATADYLHRAMEDASAEGAQLVILHMDTPGGLDLAMRKIIQDILASPIPVVTYVSPNGSRAASAGTYIMYASHVAAMAPATNLGSATPVQIIPAGLPSTPGKPSREDQEKPPAVKDDAMTHKIINDAVAYIRGLAELRGRNADWAEKAVREAANLNARSALKQGVIDLVATDMSDLLKQLNGRTVNVLGQDMTLNTEGLLLTHVEPDWRSEFLAIITDPNVAYILMLIGIYGLIFEFSNPGAFVPGITGAICLLLALFAFQVLPINYAGLALILLGVTLMVGEAFAPSFGALGIGGVIAFVIGSVILIDTDIPGYGISLPLIGAFALFSAALFAIVIGMAIKSRRRQVVTGQEEMQGSLAEVLEDFTGNGRVRAHSELWKAQSEIALHKGQQVRIIGIDGLTLQVTPDTEEADNSSTTNKTTEDK